MKKLLSLAMLSVGLASVSMMLSLPSCTADEPVVDSAQAPETEVSQSTTSRYRTVEDASRIALDAVSMFDDVLDEKSRGVMRFLDAKPIKVISGLRSRSAVNDTLMYVVNYADSMGFAVVSAVKGTPELIAVTMQGSYDPAEPCDNPGFSMYMDCAA